MILGSDPRTVPCTHDREPLDSMKHIPPTEAVVTRPVATGPGVELPAPGQLVLALERLEQAVANYPLRPAVRFHGKALTYRDLSTAIQARARVLRRLGVGPGVRLGLLLPDCPSIISYTFAAFAVGATIVHLDPAADGDTLIEAVRATGVRTLIT